MNRILKYSFLSSALLIALLVTACSSSFIARSNAKPQEIFDATCSGCHEPLAQHPDKYFALSADKRHAGYIANRIMHGGVFMPSYPHIKGDQLTALAEFVIDASVEK
jgi:mono/diheme cytochrome c family protein